jgi:hypothetical protein
MLICKGENFYKCSKTKTKTASRITCIRFSITEPITTKDVAEMFSDDTFYFYDEVLKGRMIETNNMKLVGLSITYNDDSTCDITIKLTKRSGLL